MLPKVTKASFEAIITALSDRFPDALPKTIVDLETIHVSIGQQQVIRYLKEVMEAQHG